jgi:Lon protease-like protein
MMVNAMRSLPDVLPVFPLSGALLLPGCRLPLNVFEPRYLQMVEDAVDGHRTIGVIQPLDPDSDDYEPDLQHIGCAGRISSLEQSEDGRYLISLVGIQRFEILREVANDKLYRTVEVAWERFTSDRTHAPASSIDRDELVANLRAYFATRGLEANWEAIDETENEELVNSLAMVCPFDPSEKQALLEAHDADARSRLVIGLMNMAVLHRDSPTTLH